MEFKSHKYVGQGLTKPNNRITAKSLLGTEKNVLFTYIMLILQNLQQTNERIDVFSL